MLRLGDGTAQVYASAAVAEHRATQSFKQAPAGPTSERGAFRGDHSHSGVSENW